MPSAIRMTSCVLGSALLMLLLGGPLSCSKSQPPAQPGSDTGFPDRPTRALPGRVFLFGIDGATWEIFDHLVALGVMPNLQRVVQDGSHGVLRSMDPTASAVIWTTLATGKVPDKHGIRGFVTKTAAGKTVPVNSTMRQAKAIWNIASEAGLKVGIISWWSTWPAERVNGFLCSDYVWPLKKSPEGWATGVEPDMQRDFRTYPPELMADLDRFIKTEQRAAVEELRVLGITALPPSDGYAVREVFLKDVSVGDMTVHLLGQHRPALFAVYFDGFDAYCHLFWPQYKFYLAACLRGADAVAQLDPGIQALGTALHMHLRRIDDYLGAILEQAGPDDVVLVISDHGYGDNPGGKPIMRGFDEWISPPHWHTLNGIIAAAGGPTSKAARLDDAGVLDIAPTVLALLGLPIPRDMDGRVLVELLTDEFLEQHPLEYVDTYETGQRSGEALSSPYDEQMLRRLESLGYLDREADSDSE